jgi:short-subunit dehydrogenase
LPFELADFDSVKDNQKKAVAAFGKINILSNNGGMSQWSLIAGTAFEVRKKLIEVDYPGTVALAKALLPHLTINQSGHFLTITSLMGKFGSPYRFRYCGAKLALHGFFDVYEWSITKIP